MQGIDHAINKSVFNSLEVYRGAFESVAQSMQGIDHAINKSVFNSLEVYRGAFESVAQSMQGIDHAINKSVFNSLEVYRDAFESVAQSMQGIDYAINKSVLESATKSMQIYRDAFESVAQSMQNIDYAINKSVLESATKSMQGINAISVQMAINYIDKLDKESNIIYTEPDKAFIDDSNIAIDIQECLSPLSDDDNYTSFEMRIAAVIKSLSNKHPVIYSIVKFIILVFATILFQAYLYPTQDKNVIINQYNIHINQDCKSVIRDIHENIKSDNTLDIDILEHYRIVIRPEVNIHKRPSSRSDVTTKIYQGEVVRFIEKRKRWVLIEYRDGDELNYGYIQSKYIESLIK